MQNKPQTVRDIERIVFDFRKTQNVQEFVSKMDFDIPLVDFQLTLEELKFVVPHLISLNFTQMNDNGSELIECASHETKSLTLWGCFLNKTSFELGLSAFKMLETLKISWVSFEYQLNLSHYLHLKKVKLVCFTPSTDIMFIGCSNLKSFKMRHPFKTGHNIFLQGCCSLKKLKIICAKIKSVDLSGCSSLDNITISLASLETPLDISDCVHLTNLSLSYIDARTLFSFTKSANFEKLQSLYINHNRYFDQSLELFRFPNLKNLNLGWCEHYNTPLSFDRNPKLETILLSHCYAFDKDLDVSCCEKLRQLDTKQTKTQLIQFSPNHQIEKIWYHLYNLGKTFESLLQTHGPKITIINQTIKIKFLNNV